jgi:nitroreductase
MKNLIIKLFPEYYVYLMRVLPMYFYDAKRFYLNSAFSKYKKDEIKLISNIMRMCHSIEKGLTMPDFRPGFGVKVLKRLVLECLKYVDLYNNNHIQLLHTVGVIYEYEKKHKGIGYHMDESAMSAIKDIKKIFNNTKPTSQKFVTKEEYFSNATSDFGKFSKSRASVRNYTNKSVELDDLVEAVNIAQSAPSACNRQSSKVYIYTDKEKIQEILKIQGGNSGFGHLADKLIIITSSLGVWEILAERYQSYVDGGIFAMNFLYALHFKKIAGCILNCSITPKKDKILREVCKIDKSENFIAMVSCGYPPEEINIAFSKRYDANEILKIIE